MPDRKYLNVGVVANDGTGDTLRDAADKIEYNFGQLYDKYDVDGMGSSGNAPNASTVIINSASPIDIYVNDGTEIGETKTFINTVLTTITFTGNHLSGSEVVINSLQAIVFVWSGNQWAVVSGV
jgi:hypothetical protein